MTDWPHAPVHRLSEAGAYIVTAGTYRKLHHFRAPERRSLLQEHLLSLARELGWQLQAWAIFSNHYHFVAVAPSDPGSLRMLTRQLHSITAREINRLDGVNNRQVWFEYWDTHLTFERSYLARLNYVHQNPVRHGLVPAATTYPWCSARWFEQSVSAAFYNTVISFKVDRLNVRDDYDVECGGLPPLSREGTPSAQPKSGSKLPHSKVS